MTMKTGLGFGALLAGIVMGSTGHAWSQTAPKPGVSLRAVQALAENARAVQHNAAIYQWGRVNLEVDRIVAADHQVEKELASIGTRTEQAATLKATIHELRTARLAHDADRCVRAARDLEKLSKEL